MPRWTQEQLNEYEQRRNKVSGPALRPPEPKRLAVLPLDGPAPRKETGSTRFKVRFIVRSQRPLDPDNYRLKDLLDLCVLVGFLPDDSWRHIAEHSVSSEKVHSAEEEQTAIEVIPLCINGAT